MRKNKNLPFATTWMKLEGISLSKPNRKKQIPHDIAYIINQKRKKKRSNSWKWRVEKWLPGAGG